MSVSESRSVVSNSLGPHGLYNPWNSPGQNTEVGSHSLLQGILPASPEIEPRSPTWQVDSLPVEPPGKPKNTGVGSLSLLQGIFPTQESNWGLLHYRWILYQLSYQGSPHPSEPPQNPLIILMELSPYLTLYRYLRCGIPSIAFILY